MKTQGDGGLLSHTPRTEAGLLMALHVASGSRGAMIGVQEAEDTSGGWCLSRTRAPFMENLMGKVLPTVHTWWGFPGGPLVKTLPRNTGDTCLIPGLEGSRMPWIR